MNRLRRTVFALAVTFTLALCLGVEADSKPDISNWKEILPEPAYHKLMDEAVKKLVSYTASPSQFNQNAKKIQGEATSVLVYAEIAHRAGLASTAEVRKIAADLVEAAKARKGDEAKTLAASLSDYKKLEGKGENQDLAKTTSLTLIMDIPVKDVDRNLTPYKRLTEARLADKAKAEEVELAMYKLAAMAVATSAHVPTADLPPGKTGKDWLDSAEEMRKHALAAASAAHGKKLPELKKAVNDLTAACAKCHEDFRVE